jgi:hypothetical protein
VRGDSSRHGPSTPRSSCRTPAHGAGGPQLQYPDGRFLVTRLEARAPCVSGEAAPQTDEKRRRVATLHFSGPRHAGGSRACDPDLTVSSVKHRWPDRVRSAILIGLSQFQPCDVRGSSTAAGYSSVLESAVCGPEL